MRQISSFRFKHLPRIESYGDIPEEAGHREEKGKCTMAEREHKNWRELCYAALEARDPDELLHIVQELNKVLKREEQVRRDFREAMQATEPSREIRG
jgi:hypothetical protein